MHPLVQQRVATIPQPQRPALGPYRRLCCRRCRHPVVFCIHKLVERREWSAALVT